MIDLYSFGTPNGQKAAIMLEEVGLEYKLHKINILEGDQDTDEYIAISPYSKIPAIVDHDTGNGPPYPVFESGAILMYLAEKTGQLMPAEKQARYEVIQWLMFQMGGLGPMLGQAHHFLKFGPERIPYAMERYTKEANRLYRVLNRRLADHEYLTSAYSIADIATFPWIQYWEWQGVDMAEYPNVERWFNAVAARPAVLRGLEVVK